MVDTLSTFSEDDTEPSVLPQPVIIRANIAVISIADVFVFFS